MRILVLIHRWMGIFLCLFFSVWFFSGAVLIYHPFPSLSQAERIAGSTDVNRSKISISPKEAINAANIPKPDRLRLIDREGRPIYVIHFIKDDIAVIGGDDGQRVNPTTKEAAGRIAERFANKSMDHVDGPIDYDQWIVHQRFDAYRPFYRVRFRDSEKTDIYVSAKTGEVLQKTLGSERIWNYFGAVVHWIYPTLLRRHWALWDQVVWWVSLLGVATTVAGLWLGVTRLSVVSDTNRSKISSPFNGWLWAHHVLGTLTGIFVLTWIFSGWLSMDHGRFFSKPIPHPKQVNSFRGISISRASELISSASLKSMMDFKEAEIIAVGGNAFLLGKINSEIRLYEPSSSNSISPTIFTTTQMIKAVESAWSKAKAKSAKKLEPDDIYGQLRNSSLPDSTIRITLDDPSQTWIHIDMKTGEILSVMDRSRRTYRWIYNGLHSLDFPGLSNQRPLWDIVILFLLTMGFIFSVTGVVIGWRRVSR